MSNEEPGTFSGEHGTMFTPERIAALKKIVLVIFFVCLVTNIGLAMVTSSDCVREPDQAKGLDSAIWLYRHPCYVTSFKGALHDWTTRVGFLSLVGALGMDFLKPRRA